MSTFHSQRQSLYHLVSMRMEEKLLEENSILPNTKTKKPRILSFSIKPILPSEIAQRRSVLLLLQTDFVSWSSKLLFNFAMVEN